jgi:hypothetical protein
VARERDGVLVVVRCVAVAGEGCVEPVRWADEGSFGVDVICKLLDASGDLADFVRCRARQAICLEPCSIIDSWDMIYIEDLLDIGGVERRKLELEP